MNHASSSASVLVPTSHARYQSESPGGSYTASWARPSSTTDIWGLGADLQDDAAGASGSSSAAISRSGSLHKPANGNLRRRGGPAHPLASHADGASPPEDIGTDTRPTLKRLTSETEKRLEDAGYSFGSDSWSQRGSMEVRRADKGKGKQQETEEVEVLIHQVKANETIVGIALHYGIDLATLRKANKLWPTDPVHLRTHLYVPLDACHWNKASETFVRGPGEGQVTLTLKHPKPPSAVDEGKALEPPSNPRDAFARRRSRTASDMDLRHWANPTSPDQWDFADPTENVLDPWTTSRSSPRSPESSKLLLDLSDDPSLASSDLPAPTDPPDPNVRILDIVRVPASQLRFFPRATPSEPPSSRASFESDLRRTSLTMSRAASLHRPSPRLDGPSISSNISKLPPQLQGRSDSSKKKNTVRIRPPVAIPPPTGPATLANRLSSLFVVPPPPLPGQPPRAKPSTKARDSMDSARSGLSGLSALSSPRLSRRSSMSSQPRVEVLDEVEMQVQYSPMLQGEDLWDKPGDTHRRMSSETLKPNGAVGLGGSKKID